MAPLIGKLGRTHPFRPSLVAFGSCAGLLVFVLFVSSSALHTQKLSSEMVIHTHRVIELLQATLLHMVDAETGQRGFLVTHAERYLEPYKVAKRNIAAEVDELFELTSDNAEQQDRLADLKALVTAKHKELERTIDAVQKGQTARAIEIVQSDEGKRLMDRIRTLVRDMISAEQLLLEQRTSSYAASTRALIRSLLIVSVVASACLLVGLLFSRRQALARARKEEELRISEERFKLAAKVATDAIWDWDLRSDAAWWSEGTRTLFGYTEEEVGRDAQWWYEHIHPADRDRVVSGIHAAIDGGQTVWRDEYRFSRKDGTYAVVMDRGSVMRSLDGSAMRMLGAMQDVTDARANAERLKNLAGELERRVAQRTMQLAQSEERLRGMAYELDLAEQRERTRLASELHDHLQQLLVLVKLKLGQAKRLAEPLPACAHIMVQADEALAEALAYTRTLVAELSPPVLREHGLAAGLKWLAEYMKKRDMRVTVMVPETNLPIPEEKAGLLFQSVRELLINAWKHAKTEEAAVRLETTAGRVRIEVRDEGVGCVAGGLATDMPGSPKFGLFSIRQRMEALGGSFQFDSKPGEGTTATLEMPLTQVQATPVLAPAKESYDHQSIPSARAETPLILRTVLVDDHAMVRQGLKTLLEGYADVEVVGEAADGRQAITMVDELRPAVVVMDINMPGMNGIEATREIVRLHPNTVVVGLSVNAGTENENAMRTAGAVLLMTKEAAVEQLYSVIREASDVQRMSEACSADRSSG